MPTEVAMKIREKIAAAQGKSLEHQNKNRVLKTYNVGEKVWLKSNKRLGNKLSPLFTKSTVEADPGTIVLIKGID